MSQYEVTGKLHAYKSKESKYYYIQDTVIQELIDKYNDLSNVPPDYKIVAKSLHSETELGINKADSDNVYRFGGDVEINKINELMKVSINCSDFSIFFD